MGAADDLFCESFDAEAEATARLQVENNLHILPYYSSLNAFNALLTQHNNISIFLLNCEPLLKDYISIFFMFFLNIFNFRFLGSFGRRIGSTAIDFERNRKKC